MSVTPGSEVIRITDQSVLVPMSSYPHAKWPYTNFNPVQSRLVEIYDTDANIAVASSTASGKTISSEIFMAYEIRKNKGKALYVGPLKALAKEKEQDWTSPEHHFGDLKVSICTGDYRLTDSRIKELDAADVIVMTPEMLASRCRNHKSEKSNFLKQIKVVVVDESHLLSVPSRGDHLEVALMKLTDVNPNVRIVLLSATMPNVDEICGWVSKLTNRKTYFLESNYRPCPLGIHYETYYDGDGRYEDKELAKINKALSIVEYYADDKFLVFVHTKRTGNQVVEKFAARGIPAEFHNADLGLDKRLDLEKRFKEDKKFRVLVATSTVAWGVNTPARRVVILGVDRGLTRVENYDIWQEVGRAGRPAFDPRGDAYILVPQSKKDETIAWLRNKPPIKSQLLEDFVGHHKTLAFHIVSEIHHKNVRTKEGFHEWFRKSLAFHQDQSFDDELIDSVIELLLKCKAIKIEDEQYATTPVGAVASMFYYSPFDVADLRNNFKFLFEKGMADNDIALAICMANIDSNKLNIANKQEKLEMEKFSRQVLNSGLPFNLTDGSMKMAFAYHNIINGVENPIFASTQSILKHDSERLLEVLGAIDSMSAKWNEQDYFKNLKLRVSYGVRAELVPLCKIPNVGKVRADKLYKAGVKSLTDFISTDADKLKTIMGVSLDKVKDSLDGAKQAYVLDSI